MNIQFALKRQLQTATPAAVLRLLLILAVALMLTAVGANAQNLPKVKTIRFYGNDNFSDGILREQMNLKQDGIFKRGSDFNLRILKLDRSAIKKFYEKAGYIFCTVQDSFEVIDRGDIEIHMTVVEGRKVSLKEVNIRGNELLADTEVLRLMKLKLGAPLNPYQLRKDLISIRTEYQKRGKPFIQLERQILGVDDATIVINIRENNTVFIDSIIVEGTEKVKESVVWRELLFARNDKYNIEKIQETQKRIFETGLFSNIVIEPFRSRVGDKTLNLRVSVRERDMRQLSGRLGFKQERIGGFGTAGEPTTFLNISGEWAHRNLFRSGRAIRFKGSTSFAPLDIGTRLSNIEVAYTEPWILNFRAPTTLRAFVGESKGDAPEENVNFYGAELGVFKKYSEQFSVRLTQGVRFTSAKNDTLDYSKITGFSEDAQQRAITLLVINDKRNNIFFPENGSIAFLEAKFAGGPFGGDSDIYRAEFSWSRYQPFMLRNSWTLAFRLKGGYEKVFGDTRDIPIFDRFFLGGNSSMRGYKERSFKVEQWKAQSLVPEISSIKKALVNTELRFPIYWRIGGEMFIDGGNLWKNDEKLSLAEIKFTIGAGLTFTSPMGPVRIDYGYKLNKLETDSDSDSRIHFGLLFAF